MLGLSSFRASDNLADYRSYCLAGASSFCSANTDLAVIANGNAAH
jgi:hypothetical protein